MNKALYTSAILFDLDGTLADTAPDMGIALNRLLEEENRAPMPAAQMRTAAARGGRSMVEHGFGKNLPTAQLSMLLERFLALYQQNLCIQTHLFPNVADTLKHLSQQNILWGVVTNKPGYLAEPLLAKLGIGTAAACCIYGDTTPEKKPSPMPLLHAATLIERQPQHCIYIGDSERDMQAAVQAQMQPWFAAYGYEPISATSNYPVARVLNDISEVLHNLDDMNDDKLIKPILI